MVNSGGIHLPDIGYSMENIMDYKILWEYIGFYCYIWIL